MNDIRLHFEMALRTGRVLLKSGLRLAVVPTPFLFAASAEAQSTPSPIVLSGDATPAGGTYSNFDANSFSSPVLNASARVAFLANVSGGSSPSGIFTGTTLGGLRRFGA